LLARLAPGGQPQRPAEENLVARSADAVDVVAAAPAVLSTAQPWDGVEDQSGGHFEAWTNETASFAQPQPSSPVSLRILLEDRSEELEALDDRSLLQALRQADERTVQRALAASSEKFLNRVAGKLPRRQANRLRQMVRSIGPTRLTELREAQHELLRLAHEHRTQVAA
ncbi:MAG TPA: FliG C-terminal domain-containing protein, partial [Lacipirellula sp.]